jgi:hypothetical protein
MKKIETIQVAVFYCDVCGTKCGSSMTTLTLKGQDFHACGGWNEFEVMCRDQLHDVATEKAKDIAP